MRRCGQVLWSAVWLALVSPALAQGTFQNLDFESPSGSLDSIYPPNIGAAVWFTNAFPGWVGYVGTNQATVVRIDGVNLDNATLALIRSNIVVSRTIPLIEGNHTAVLQAGYDPMDITATRLVQVSLFQSSLVPVDSRSLLFKGYTVSTPFAVTLGGQNIPLIVLETHPSYKLYGGDISAYAGSVAELRFTAFPDDYPRSTIFAIDSIVFSPSQIPEPNVLGLFALGALFLSWQLRKRF